MFGTPVSCWLCLIDPVQFTHRLILSVIDALSSESLYPALTKVLNLEVQVVVSHANTHDISRNKWLQIADSHAKSYSVIAPFLQHRLAWFQHPYSCFREPEKGLPKEWYEPMVLLIQELKLLNQKMSTPAPVPQPVAPVPTPQPVFAPPASIAPNVPVPVPAPTPATTSALDIPDITFDSQQPKADLRRTVDRMMAKRPAAKSSAASISENMSISFDQSSIRRPSPARKSNRKNTNDDDDDFSGVKIGDDLFT